MALQSSGAISLYNVNIELQRSGTQTISMGESAVRTLFQVGSGAISMSNGYGKSNLTQAAAVSWMASNRNAVTLWCHGGTTDVRATNSPYVRYVSSSTWNPTCAFSGINSSWTTVVVTVMGYSPTVSTVTINNGGIGISSTADPWGGSSNNRHQRIHYVNTNITNITSVQSLWTHSNGNGGSWCVIHVMPGKWDGYTTATLPNSTGTVYGHSNNTVSIAARGMGYNGNYQFLTAITAGNYITANAWWYNNGAFAFVANASGSSSNVTYRTGATDSYGNITNTSNSAITYFTSMSTG